MNMKSIYKYGVYISLFILPNMAQAATKSKAGDLLDMVFDNIFFFIAGVVIIGAFMSIWNFFQTTVDTEIKRLDALNGIEPKPYEPQPSWFSKMYKKALNMVPVDREADIDLGHDYDGIRELDNSLPPWWVYLFYFTIAFGCVYMYIYRFSDIGPSQQEEYYADMKIADKKRRAFLFEESNKVNETNVVRLTGAADIAAGKEIFMSLCSSCHGKLGEGMAGLGPNFTDQYWLHGGDIKNLFSTIKYGVQEKGMISWKSQLQPSDMQKVASYILTLQGTDPPNAKAPQGELYVPEEK